MRRAIKRQSGFTLLELILSLAVVVVLAAVCLVGIRLALASRDAGTQKADIYQRLRVLHEQMNRSIRSAHFVLIPKPSDSLIEEDEQTKSQKSKILAFEGKTDSLKFITFSPPLAGNGPDPGMHLVHIYLKTNPATGASKIILEERDFSPETFMEKDEFEDESIQVLTLARDVAFLKFRYYQPEDTETETEDEEALEALQGGWLDEILPVSFEMQTKKTTEEKEALPRNLSLPQKIEISVGLWEPPQGGKDKHESWVELPRMVIPLETAMVFEEKQNKETPEDEIPVE